MNPYLSHLLFPVFIAVLIFLPIWAFSPFDQGIFISWLIGASITQFGMYGYDKGQASSGSKRVPELNLHLFSIIGGAVGGLLGMLFFRHKTRKKIFLLVSLAAAVVHGIIAFFQLT